MEKEKREKKIKIIRITVLVIFITAMILLWSVNWKVAIGVLLFGWAMNLENKELKL